MTQIEIFEKERKERIDSQGKNSDMIKLGKDFLYESLPINYSYNFSWMGRPLIQYPQDIIAMQEIVWDVKPDIIIETGIAHGGSLVFYASLLESIGNGDVLGIDIDIRLHNRKAIENHIMYKRIKMIEGSSIADDVIVQVKNFVRNKKRILVALDSNHVREHVLKELQLYSQFVTKNSYLVIFDTYLEDLPDGYDFGDRPWGKGNNPKTAVREFLKYNDDFVIDKTIDNKLLITVAPGGYLRRIK